MKKEKYYQAYLDHNTISRRGLFRGLLKGMNKSHQLADQYQPVDDRVRPPGMTDPALFLHRCTGCGDCERSCPEGLIIMQDNKPELDFTASYCSRCEACAHACPTGALQTGEAKIMARPVVSARCHNTFAYCASCADSCQRSAIEWRGQQSPIVDPDKCDGCGECAFECQPKAITMALQLPG
ncbi:4Fe-4S binding protein [Photobacterium sagamiensis]|uniref:4Fe-4S binding protein n=1 Tax=Photobacterium sagamiensis TaxID=2910241 RepID=UPI003D0FE9A0